VSLLSIFDVSGSAMSAETVRLNTTASNLANAQSVTSNFADTYRARHPVFATQGVAGGDGDAGTDAGSIDENDQGRGVKVLGIVQSNAPLQMRYEPDHPLANADGYVAYPNVNVVQEMADMISATRAFQMNVEVLNSAKNLAERVLTLGQ
jgi:flagellar basal-body rod protein FlgC